MRASSDFEYGRLRPALVFCSTFFAELCPHQRYGNLPSSCRGVYSMLMFAPITLMVVPADRLAVVERVEERMEGSHGREGRGGFCAYHSPSSRRAPRERIRA